MAFSPDDDEGEAPLLRSEAEITLKLLLDKQLSTSARLEQVEFQQAIESTQSLGHGSSGLSSLSDFVKNELAQKQLLEKTRLLQNVLHGMGYSKERVQERCQKLSYLQSPTSTSSDKGTKRKRYGADPLFLLHSETEDLEIASLESEHTLKEEITNGFNQTSFSRHSKELEVSLLRGKDRLQALAHLSGGGSACRKPLFGETEGIYEQLCMTPQERARHSKEKENSRLTNDVFARPAPEVLELHSYLSQKSRVELDSSAEATLPELVPRQYEQHVTFSHAQELVDLVKETPEEEVIRDRLSLDEVQKLPHSQKHVDLVKETPEEEIIRNRLSLDEVRKLPCGKFANYSPGNISNVLYIKNLSGEVTEADLVALFVRYQSTQQPLLFRLMKRGRMKGQAFVTFSDEGTALKALQLLNGYKLKGKPMVIEFGHGSSGTSCTHE